MLFLKKLWQRFGRKDQKVMAPDFALIWTDKNRNDLNVFMQSEAGKSLANQLKADLYFSQVQACVPGGTMGGNYPLEANERCAIAHGKALILTKFEELFTIDVKEPDFAMSDSDLSQVLHNRINGFMPDEVEL